MPTRLIVDAKEIQPEWTPPMDAHLHTTWGDGEQSVPEVYQAAINAGLKAILFSEHACKKDAGWFGKFAEEVRSLPPSSCRPFVGAECNIADCTGCIDTVPAIVEVCDLMMVSVLSLPDAKGNKLDLARLDPQKAMEIEYELSWAALANPQVDILGRIFGICYHEFDFSPPEEKLRALIARAVEYDVAIEINAKYHPNPVRLMDLCAKAEARITFGSNAHRAADVGATVKMLQERSME